MLLFLKNKLLWIGLGIIMLAAGVFTFAFMGSTVNPSPKELPLAVVMEDEGVKQPNGEQLNFGEILVREIKRNDTSSVKWKVFDGKEEAIEAMNEKKLYAAIVLPQNLTQNIFSLLTDLPTTPASTIIINEGMNQVGVNIANQIANGVLSNFNQQIQSQIYAQVEGMKSPITTDFAKLISNPVTIETEKINPVPVNNANGNTPALFTQILWIGTFISSMILFILARKSNDGNLNLGTIISQILSGVLYVTFISGTALLLAVHVLDVSISNEANLLLAMVFIGLCFFLLQSALLNWIGYIASPILILLYFFAMPILTLAPEMLPDVTKDYLYSWVPFRFSLEIFRDILFFDKGIFDKGIGVIGGIGLVSFVVMGLAIFKPTKRPDKMVESGKGMETSMG